MSTMEKRGPGRPRSDASRQAILRAAYELLEEKGVANFTIEGVAARSGSAKTTIYRWWPSRGMLATEALLGKMQTNVPCCESESVVCDLRVLMRGLADLLSGATGQVLAGLIAESQSCASTSEAILHNIVLRRGAAGHALLERGVASGELRADIDVSAALDALFGPFYARLMLHRFPLEDGWVDRLADTVLHGIAADPAAATAPNTRSS